MPDILVVEDDENLNRGITFSLKKSGYEVFSAESVKKAKRIASDNNVDVTICDVNLPDGNGLEFVRWMRCNYNTYIICLTALDQEMDQVMGYEAGADDYITKPFSLSVLLLKIEAHFRRRQEKTEAGKMISGDIVFIAGEMKVLIKSREISLTKTELKMLTFFLQNPKQILSKTQILENVFDLEGDFVDENTIAVNIRRLREKIEDNPAAPVYIKNIRGLGTICVALIIGLPLGYALFSYAKHNGIFGMNIYHVPIVPIFIMIFLVGLLQIVLSCVLSSNLKKETLVERIRYDG